MTGLGVWLVVAGALALAVVVGIVLNRNTRMPTENQRPEPADATDTTSDRFYRGVDRPAGPDAEEPGPGHVTGPEAPPA